jgi:hypothetical protein
VLGAQALVVFASAREPYPGIRLPGFAGAPTSDETFSANRLEVTIEMSDGSHVEPDLVQFAGPFGYSALKPTLNFVFRPSEDGHQNPRAADPAVITWLRERAEDVSPDQDPVAVRFCWRTTTIDITDGSTLQASPCEITEMRL